MVVGQNRLARVNIKGVNMDEIRRPHRLEVYVDGRCMEIWLIATAKEAYKVYRQYVRDGETVVWSYEL